MPFRIAVVGTGFIGPVHVEGLRRAGQEVVGILGSTPEKSRRAATALGIPRGYANFDEVLQDSSVQSVHITTPNRLHFQQAAAALKAGKHVLCEKPLAMNSRESAELVDIAAASGRAAGVAYNVRFYPLGHEARERVAGGEFGTLLHATGSYVQDWLLKETDFNWRVLAEEGGELRALADIGTHWLDLVQFITGQRVVSVLADLHTIHKHRQRPPQGSIETFSGKANTGPSGAASSQSVPVTTDDAGSVLLRFENGASGALWVSQVTAGRKNCLRLELAGSGAALAWNSELPNELWIGHRDRANEVLLRDPALLAGPAQAIANYPGGHNEGFPDTFKQLFRAFYGSIERGEEAGGSEKHAPFAYPTFADGHYEILLCEAILRSHRERRWVEVAQ
jgi:predicted dehydrogenase